jgi:hypothetical protein
LLIKLFINRKENNLQYIVYNLTKKKRLPGEFEYKEILFSRNSLGRIIRMLLDEEWAGDKIAILPVDKWEADKGSLIKAGITRDPVKAEVQSIVFCTETAHIKPFIVAEDSFIGFNNGSVYEVEKSKRIDRFDALIPLISVDPPEHLYERYYLDMNGKWAFVPLHMSTEAPENKEDISWKYDIENFFRTYPDEAILEKVAEEDIPDDGFWIGDLIGLFEEEDEEEQ